MLGEVCVTVCLCLQEDSSSGEEEEECVTVCAVCNCVSLCRLEGRRTAARRRRRSV